MYSTLDRLRCIVVPGLLASGAVAFIGCQQRLPTPTERASETPLIIDEAMRIRQWEQTRAYYVNGATPAGPVLFPFEPDPNADAWVGAVSEPFIFLGNVVATPITIFSDPAWGGVNHAGVRYEPTYTFQPVLEPIP